jgi:GDP-L-fucose synthase
MAGRILLTGGSGFIGGNVLRDLKNTGHNVVAPRRSELNLSNRDEVIGYLKDNRFDVVVHFATPSPYRSPDKDSYETLFEDSLNIFMNLYAARSEYGRLLYSGSGAEYDKRRELKLVSEEQIGESIPIDSYGLSKFIINDIAKSSQNIYNLRVFACFGPKEYDSKFITHAVRCCLSQQPITIRQDCWFDYLYVDDYARYVSYFVDHEPCRHDYNACSGVRIRLSDIAHIVSNKFGGQVPISIASAGMNLEYTGSNERIVEETGIKDLIGIETAIDKLIAWEKEHYEASSC